MAEGGLPPNDYPGRSFGYGRFYPPNFEARESLDDYMDVQPLDFSTKRRKSPERDNDDKERCLTIERRVNDLDINGRFPLGESGATPRRSLDMEDAFRFTPMSLAIPPEASTSLSPPNSAAPSPSGSLSPGLTPSALARFHSNPLLLSTLQSALSRSNMSDHGRSYLTPRNSPPPPDYASLAGHSSDMDHIPDERGFQMGGLAGLRGAGGAGASGLTAGGLGANSLGIGGGLGITGLGRRSSSGSVNPYEDHSHSFDSLGAFGSLSSTLATDNIALLGNAYSTLAAMNSLSSNPSEAAMAEESNACYLKFREEMLKQVQAAKSRRAPHRPNGPERSEEASNENVSSALGSEHTEESEAPNAEALIAGASSADASIVGASNADVSNIDVSNVDSSFSDAGNFESSQNNAQEDISGGARRKTRTNSDVVKDEAYWERRRKNNEAAKRSRDARRAKEDEIAIRAAYLEQENIKLKVELNSLKAETSKLRYLFYS